MNTSLSAALLTLAISLGIGACSDGGGEDKGGATPPESVSEADPKGAAGTSDQ